MKKILVIALTATLCGCQSSKLKISGRFVGNEEKTVYLERASHPQRTLDSARLDEAGNFRMEIKGAERMPELYNLVCNGERIPLLLSGGDRIVVEALGNLTRNYTVEGSAESDLLRTFYQSYTDGVRKLDKLAATYARTTGSERQSAIRSYSEEFRRIKRDQLRFIIENKHSLAAVYALYQRLPGDPYLFNGESDVIYYRTVAEALHESYPESAFLKSLESDIEKLEARREVLANVRESGYPDLELTDMYGKKVRLSSLDGKMILLEFWSAELGNSNALNAELKQIYHRFAERGFEIYQVAVDQSKPVWINAVQEQELPWISVSDLQGRNSIACRLYNVEKLPTNVLIDRGGNIVARDLHGKSLERKLEESL